MLYFIVNNSANIVQQTDISDKRKLYFIIFNL